MRTSLRPLHTAQLFKRQGFDRSGEVQYSDAIAIRFSWVDTSRLKKQTSVRADTSGSQAFAEENLFEARMMVYPDQQPAVSDRIVAMETTYDVTAVKPRYDMAGRLHHYQVDLRR